MRKYSKVTRVIIFLCAMCALLLGEVFLFQLSEKYTGWTWALLFGMLECTGPVILFFVFFQAFKYYRLAPGFYHSRSFESERYFRFLGVHVFRIILVRSFFRYANQRVYLKNRGTDYIKTFIEETRQSETSHVFALVLTLVIQAFHWYNGQVKLFWSVSLFSVLFNLYPILLQRRNRFLFESKLNSTQV